LFKIGTDYTWESISLQNILSSPYDKQGFGAIKIDENDIVWIGTLSKGILGYNPENHQLPI